MALLLFFSSCDMHIYTVYIGYTLHGDSAHFLHQFLARIRDTIAYKLV